MAAIAFTPLERGHLALLHEWLQRDHVREWWGPPQTRAEVEEEYLPAIDGTEPVRVFLIKLDARPIGMIQACWGADEPGVAGLDLLIGEEQLVGRGLGPRILREFMRTIVLADPGTTAFSADPDVANGRSIRA